MSRSHRPASVKCMLQNRLPTLRDSILTNKQMRITKDEIKLPPNWKSELEKQLATCVGFIDKEELSALSHNLNNSTTSSILFEAAGTPDESEYEQLGGGVSSFVN